jgi:hypothetical protein
MRNRFWGFVVPLMASAVCTGVLAERQVAAQARGAAQTAPAYRAPRTADGKPNLSGIWQSMNEANWNIEAHSADFGRVTALGAVDAVVPGLGIVEGGPIPYLPAALAKKKENYDNRLKLDPEIKCYLPGVPRAMYQNMPFQIIQSTDYIIIAFQYAGALRTIYMKPTPGPADSWMGWSNGKWEGETLVIDTKDFNGMAWFDRSGNFASEKLHVVERITAASPDHLNYEATIEDPQTFSRPWKISMPLYRRKEPNARLLEFKCVEFSEEVVYGHLRKVPLN